MKSNFQKKLSAFLLAVCISISFSGIAHAASYKSFRAGSNHYSAYNETTNYSVNVITESSARGTIEVEILDYTKILNYYEMAYTQSLNKNVTTHGIFVKTDFQAEDGEFLINSRSKHALNGYANVIQDGAD